MSRIPKSSIIVMFLSGKFFHVVYILYLKEPTVMNTERTKMCICACSTENEWIGGLKVIRLLQEVSEEAIKR